MNDTHHTEDEKQSIISALMMLKPETAKLQDELKSQLKEVDTKLKENKKRRQWSLNLRMRPLAQKGNY